MAEPAWNWDVSWAFPIEGPTVQFASYDPFAKALLVAYQNGSFVTVPNIQSFDFSQDSERAVLSLVDNWT